ncbi:EpsG family protein [Acinetobacter sp. YH12233]|uniref:EpsG family protein n=1 Tax=Acinetobacter sp. YH12233 TaxID=2601161 RepID=UPI0015D32C54|nr:EpsG family protein [Acinetobacter sp. YH12233]
MYIYFLIWFSIVLTNFIVNYKTPLSKIFFFLFLIFLIFFIGFRYEVGGDWENYFSIYKDFKYLGFTEAMFIMDPGYSFLNLLGNYLNIREIWFVNFISSIIICVFIFLSFVKLEKYWLCMLIYFPYHILVVSLGYTRQAIAVAILVYAFIFLLNDKRYQFIFFLLVASLFHKTAIVFMLFYPILYLKNKRLLMVIYQFCSLIFVTFIVYMSSISDRSIYTTNDVVTSSGALMRLTLHFIPLVFYLFYRKVFFKSKYLILDYFFLLILYCTAMSFVYSTLADRFNVYLIFFDLYVLINIYKNFYAINKKIIVLFLTLFYTGFIGTWLLNSEIVKIAWIPYKNYLWAYLLEIL